MRTSGPGWALGWTGVGWNRAVGSAPCLSGKAAGPSSLWDQNKGCEKVLKQAQAQLQLKADAEEDAECVPVSCLEPLLESETAVPLTPISELHP